MALRAQIADKEAEFPDPIHGINLRDTEADIKPTEARLMQNCIYRGGVRTRYGGSRITASSLGAFRIRGGHKYYYGGASPTGKRLVAYSTKISHINDAGAEANLTSGMTSDKDTHFCTWSITDKCYIVNSNDTLRSYDGTTFATVTGTAIPTAGRMIQPILDRLMCITPNGIERTSPRVDNVWSLGSDLTHGGAWATLRPSLTGLFTALYPHTLVSVMGDVHAGLLAFQANAYYMITGTDFGADASAAAASSGEDSAIALIDPRVGTSSPYSVCSVPGVGVFWFTSDCYVYYVPYGQPHGRYVGDKIYSTCSTQGTESTNTAAISAVHMCYFDRYLRLFIPVGSDTYPTIEYWLDMREFMKDPTNPVWAGPMTGRSISHMWSETANGENALFYGEGNSATGAYVYQGHQLGVYTDPVGAADNNIQFAYQTFFNDYGAPSRRKYLRNVEMDLNGYTGNATLDLYDLTGSVATALPINAVTR